MTSNPHPRVLAVLAAAALAWPAAHGHDGPRAANAWARPTVPGQMAGGGYLSIRGGKADDRLVAAATPVAERVELHEMAMQGDVMRMREVGSVRVPAGTLVELKPGGLHLMFMGLKTPLTVGAKLPLTLRFEKAGEVKLEAVVQVRPPEGAAAGHKH